MKERNLRRSVTYAADVPDDDEDEQVETVFTFDGLNHHGNSFSHHQGSHLTANIIAQLPSKQFDDVDNTILRSASYDKAKTLRRRKSSARRASHGSSLSRHDHQVTALDDEEINWVRRQTIKDLTTSLDNKRKFRSHLMSVPTTSLSGFKKWKYNRAVGWRKVKTNIRNVFSYLKVWRDSFKVIEGHFGTGILQYFRFLKWLFFLNFLISIIMISVIILPQATLDPRYFHQSVRILNESNISIPLEVTLNEETCSIGSFSIASSLPMVAERQSDNNATTATYDITTEEMTTEEMTTVANVSGGSNQALIDQAEAFYYQKMAIVCTCSYDRHVKNITQGGVYYVVDFLQGTGWMERTQLFYGTYFNKSYVEGSLEFISSNTGVQLDGVYNMGLAYLLVIAVSFLLSLVLMVRQSAHGVKETLIISEDKYFRYCTMVFSGWDFALTNTRTSLLKHRQLMREIMTELEEEKLALKKATRSTVAKCKLYTVRLFVNLLVLAFLGGAFYGIFIATTYSAKWATEQEVLGSTALQLLVQYFPSVTITFLNFIIPEIFIQIVLLEDYNPGFEIKLTLLRTVFLRLASLAVLIITVWNQVTDCSTQCGNCMNNGIYCWETYIGQQVYKLVLLNFLVIFAVTFFGEFPRKLVVDKFKGNKFIDLVGFQEFEIPRNVLDLVYTQTLCWLGLFFSPLIPAITLVKCFLFFYFKKWSLLYNCVPSSRAYRTSKSNFFFTIVLMVSFLLPIVFIGYAIARFPPSQSCGPFRIYSAIEYNMFSALADEISTWPNVIKSIVEFLGTPGFYIPAGILLILAILYHLAVAAAQKKLLVLLKEQLASEGKDKQFLLLRVNEALTKKQNGIHHAAVTG